MPEQSLIPGRQQVALASEDRKKNACSRPEWVSLRLQMVVGGGRRRICHFLSGLQSLLTCLASRIAGERFGGGMRSSVSTQI